MVNGGAGLRFDGFTVTPLDDGPAGAERRDVALGGLRVGDNRPMTADPHELCRERRAIRRQERGLDGPVLARHERPDLALAFHHQPNGHRLDPPRREARANLARDQRAERVADQAVDDAARLLGIHKVDVDPSGRGECRPDGRLRDLAERDPAGSIRWQVGRLRDVPRDRLAFPVEVGGEEDAVRAPPRLLDRGDLPAPVGWDLVVGREVVLDIHPQLALARVLGQVADVAVRREHCVAGAEVAFDRLRLRRRLDDHEVRGHGERV